MSSLLRQVCIPIFALTLFWAVNICVFVILAYNADMATNALINSTDTKRNPSHWTAETAPLGKPITSENARALARLRWEKTRGKVAAALAEAGRSVDPAVLHGTGYDVADAVAFAAAKQYAAILDSEKPRMDDLVKLVQLAGAAPSAYDMAERDTGAAVSVSLSAAGLARLVGLLTGGAADVVDGEVSEAGDSGGGGG